MKSSQVLPVSVPDVAPPQRGWHLPALTPAGLSPLLLSRASSSSPCPSPATKPPQSLTHCPKSNPALSLRGHHLPPPACLVRLSILLLQWRGVFPSIQNNPQFPLLLPKSCGDQSRPGCTFSPGPKGTGTRPPSSIKFILQKGCFSQSRVQTVAN